MHVQTPAIDTQRATEQPKSFVPVHAPPISPPRSLTAMAVRRPLISASGDIAGFEFRVDGEALRILKNSADVHSISAYIATVLIAARLMALEGRIGFARLPAAWLVYAAVPKNEPGTWIGVEWDADERLEPDVQTAIAVAVAVQLFRDAGAKLAWSPSLDLGSADLLPDFLLLGPTASTIPSLLDTVKSSAPMLRSLPIILTDIANVEDLELALQSGVSYACGVTAAVAPLPLPAAGRSGGDLTTPKGIGDAQPLPPEVSRVAQLLHQLSSSADTDLIISAIKGDIGLSFRLLQRINSASFAHLGAASSIDQAVLMVGRNELQRWLSLMLMQFTGTRKVASALQEIALWRSRLVELLAIEHDEAEPGQFFTLGLASMLGMLLNVSMAEVVRILCLPPFAAQALLEHTGPWHVYLRTAEQVEAQKMTEEQAVVDGFGGAVRVLELSNDAWNWAAANADRSKR